MTWSILMSWASVFFPNAIIYSGANSFYSQLWSWGVDSFHTFRDTVLYYLFNSMTISVIINFAAFFIIALWVAFFASLFFGDWFWSTKVRNSRIKSLWNPKPSSWLFTSSK